MNADKLTMTPDAKGWRVECDAETIGYIVADGLGWRAFDTDGRLRVANEYNRRHAAVKLAELVGVDTPPYIGTAPPYTPFVSGPADGADAVDRLERIMRTERDPWRDERDPITPALLREKLGNGFRRGGLLERIEARAAERWTEAENREGFGK